MERVRVRIVRSRWLRAIGRSADSVAPRRLFKVGPKRNDLVSDDGPAGDEDNPSCLLSEKGNMWCLRFICDKLLHPVLSKTLRHSVLLGLGTPKVVDEEVGKMANLTRQQKCAVRRALRRIDEDVATGAIHWNDDCDCDLQGLSSYGRRKWFAVREAALRTMFRRLGIDLSFVE